MAGNVSSTHHTSFHNPCKSHIASAIAQVLSQPILQSQESKPLQITEDAIFKMLEKPPETSWGDYSFPCFRFAKELKLPPPKIASIISEALSQVQSPWIASVQVMQAFVNIHVNQATLYSYLVPLVRNGEYFKSQHAHRAQRSNVMVEYSQPNTHKEFHVGHMRNVCLGSALVRLYRYAGYHVTAVNYFGDEGAHIAKCLWNMSRTKAEPPAEVDKGAWLGECYVAATRALDEANEADRPKYDEEISNILRGIESKKGPWYDLWLQTKEWSLQAFRDVYRWMDAPFDRDFFESEVSEDSQRVVDEYLAQGVFKEDQGAVGIDLSDYKLGFMLVRKRDGNTLYATKDLSLAKRKFEEFHIDKSIYVVASEQNHHFKQVFKTLDLMGFKQASQCYHLSYGLVVLPSGKMSSRVGNTVPFARLKHELTKELDSVLAKYRGQWTDQEIDDTRKKLSVGAIVYGMVSADPGREIVFDMKDWLSFEGNTGPYLMYSFSRAKSVLSKAKEAGFGGETTNFELSRLNLKMSFEESERELLRGIYDFNDVVFESCEHNRPNHLAHHLFGLAKSFSRFYADVPVLKEADKSLVERRLGLVDAFAKTLTCGLQLLGMSPPERM